MRNFITMLAIFLIGNIYAQNSMKFDSNKYPTYDGDDLGLTYTTKSSIFKVWAPTAETMICRLYESADAKKPIITKPMFKNKKTGVWSINFDSDIKGKFYTFSAFVNGKWSKEVPDPYCKSVGVNGKRGVVIDLKDTNPDNWRKTFPTTGPKKADPGQIIYELHVRDASIALNSGIKNKGKFIGLAEKGTTNAEGLSTGLDHIKELGVTHVHLLPTYDYYTVNEAKLDSVQYNWGYDPLNYNVPEGSYSTNPYDPIVRISEFKTMIQAMHEKGLKVVLDVVYNHTMFGKDSYMNELVPNYYYRHKDDGSFSNGSGCGNETASERPMVRKFILESVKYWMQEYNVDGFRFDLMGLHDIETMNLISAELRKTREDILIYGEGWTGGECPLPEEQRAVKKYNYKLNHIAAFCDDMRDAIKGSVFDHQDKGFVSGKKGMEESVKFGIVGAIKHNQIDYTKVNYSKTNWTNTPLQCINYVSCHDNHTLWDRLNNSNPNDSEEKRIKMHKLAESIVLTSQGIPFLLAGTEFLRSKNGVENSFQSPDSINQIDWSRKTKYQEVFDYMKALIQLRKNHSAFRMPTQEMVNSYLKFDNQFKDGMIGFSLVKNANNDTYKTIYVVYNANENDMPIELPRLEEGSWKIICDGNNINEKGFDKEIKDKVTIPGISMMIFADF